MFLGINLTLSDVSGRELVSFLDGVVKEFAGDFEAVVGPYFWVKGCDVILGSWVCADEIGSVGTDGVPVCIRERSVKIVSLSIDDGIPNGVKVFGSANAWKRDTVASSITSWELFVHSGSGMEWLMNITGIVNQKSDGCGKSFFLACTFINVRHNLLIDVSLVISSSLGHPQLDGINSFGNIMGVGFELWEISDCGTCIIKIRLIDEMPSGLP